MPNINFLFEERSVTPKGKVFRRFLGDSDRVPPEIIKQQEELFRQFIGQNIQINGKTSVLLEVEGSSICNLVNRNYYIYLLTDEEFEKREINYSI
jgi:hypothetical protein